MSCGKVRRKLAGYLDGGLEGWEHTAVRQHLAVCSVCRAELDAYWKLSRALGQVEPAEAPADLATRIRVVVSRERAHGWRERVASQTALFFENLVQPLLVPALGGLAVAMLLFVLFTHNLLGGIPGTDLSDDQPVNLVRPAQLEALAPFPVPALVLPSGHPETVVLDATVNASGEAVDYRILSGPQGEAVRHQLEQILLFSRFRPLMSFGQPVSGGHVVLGFSGIRVKG
jgi:anti-sigma factor RsiW